MARCSTNGWVACLNFAMFLLSLFILIIAVTLANQKSSLCEKFFDKPRIAMGVVLFVVSLAGFIGSCYRIASLMYIHLVAMLTLIIVHVFLIIFISSVINSGAKHPMSEQGYMHRKVSHNWNKIKTCLQETQTCRGFSNTTYLSYEDYAKRKLSALEFGCCKPPSECQFEYVNPATWRKPSEINPKNQDCAAWTDGNLCLDCQSCKAGVLRFLKTYWQSEIKLNMVSLFFLVVIFSLACSAFRKNKKEGAYLNGSNPSFVNA